MEHLVQEHHAEDRRHQRLGDLERGQPGAQVARLERALHHQEPGRDQHDQRPRLPEGEDVDQPVGADVVRNAAHQRRRRAVDRAGRGPEQRGTDRADRAPGHQQAAADEPAEDEGRDHPLGGWDLDPTATGIGHAEEHRQAGHQRERKDQVVPAQSMRSRHRAEGQGERQAHHEDGLDEHHVRQPERGDLRHEAADVDDDPQPPQRLLGQVENSARRMDVSGGASTAFRCSSTLLAA